MPLRRHKPCAQVYRARPHTGLHNAQTCTNQNSLLRAMHLMRARQCPSQLHSSMESAHQVLVLLSQPMLAHIRTQWLGGLGVPRSPKILERARVHRRSSCRTAVKHCALPRRSMHLHWRCLACARGILLRMRMRPRCMMRSRHERRLSNDRSSSCARLCFRRACFAASVHEVSC